MSHKTNNLLNQFCKNPDGTRRISVQQPLRTHFAAFYQTIFRAVLITSCSALAISLSACGGGGGGGGSDSSDDRSSVRANYTPPDRAALEASTGPYLAVGSTEDATDFSEINLLDIGVSPPELLTLDGPNAALGATVFTGQYIPAGAIANLEPLLQIYFENGLVYRQSLQAGGGAQPPTLIPNAARGVLYTDFANPEDSLIVGNRNGRKRFVRVGATATDPITEITADDENFHDIVRDDTGALRHIITVTQVDANNFSQGSDVLLYDTSLNNRQVLLNNQPAAAYIVKGDVPANQFYIFQYAINLTQTLRLYRYSAGQLSLVLSLGPSGNSHSVPQFLIDNNAAFVINDRQLYRVLHNQPQATLLAELPDNSTAVGSFRLTDTQAIILTKDFSGQNAGQQRIFAVDKISGQINTLASFPFGNIGMHPTTSNRVHYQQFNLSTEQTEFVALTDDGVSERIYPNFKFYGDLMPSNHLTAQNPDRLYITDGSAILESPSSGVDFNEIARFPNTLVVPFGGRGISGTGRYAYGHLIAIRPDGTRDQDVWVRDTMTNSAEQINRPGKREKSVMCQFDGHHLPRQRSVCR